MTSLRKDFFRGNERDDSARFYCSQGQKKYLVKKVQKKRITVLAWNLFLMIFCFEWVTGRKKINKIKKIESKNDKFTSEMICDM